MSGILLFSIGWLGLLDGFKGLGWWANPIYIVAACLALKRKKTIFILSIIALIFALEFSFYNHSNIILSDQGGGPFTLGTGYFIWVSSFIIFAIFAGINYFHNKTN